MEEHVSQEKQMIKGRFQIKIRRTSPTSPLSQQNLMQRCRL